MSYSVEWKGDHVRLLDQSLLPSEERYIDIRTSDAMADAIRTMKVRGAPAIGVAAAYGVVLAALATGSVPVQQRVTAIESEIDRLAGTRPTAVNLFVALERMRTALHHAPVERITNSLLIEAQAIHDEEIRATMSISMYGASLIPPGATVLTHCNAGAIATAAHGTALGAIIHAHRQGHLERVYATETRPLCQGARLTAWELTMAHIPTTVITDSMVAYVMAHCSISCVMVGADRVAANGDVANKIGTYGIAVLAKAHSIPFYVAAPLSTIDLNIHRGDSIPIEQRSPSEVAEIGGRRIAANGCEILNPAFDVTPHSLVTAIVTERGIIERPNKTRLHEAVGGQCERRS
ncbi:MAG TPA: S-methyl-5-thioribose-1-phosphate isomerase [Chloroflexi bacterium]|nr:S-methyl-5-thioribose-1-phosphate isomerase [Chloroflexota bacterium]